MTIGIAYFTSSKNDKMYDYYSLYCVRSRMKTNYYTLKTQLQKDGHTVSECRIRDCIRIDSIIQFNKQSIFVALLDDYFCDYEEEKNGYDQIYDYVLTFATKSKTDVIYYRLYDNKFTCVTKSGISINHSTFVAYYPHPKNTCERMYF